MLAREKIVSSIVWMSGGIMAWKGLTSDEKLPKNLLGVMFRKLNTEVVSKLSLPSAVHVKVKNLSQLVEENTVDYANSWVLHGETDFWCATPSHLTGNLFDESDKILQILIAVTYSSNFKDIYNEKDFVELFRMKDFNGLPQSKAVLLLRLLGNVAASEYGAAIFQVNPDLLDHVHLLTNSTSNQIAFESQRVVENVKNIPKFTYSSNIYPVVCDKEPQYDLIFVHGIRGSAQWTWRQHDTCNSEKTNSVTQNDAYSWFWPKDWLLPDLKVPVRLLVVNYPSNWWHSPKLNSQENYDLDELTHVLNKDLQASNVGCRPIIWVAHSMGGILVKKLLSDESPHGEANRFAGNTRGVIFLSVPHFGSPLASYMCKLGVFVKPSSLLNSMKLDSTEFEENSTNDFLRLCQKYHIQVMSLNETLPASITPYGPSFIFVPSNSGDLTYGSFHELKCSHLDVCKPVSKNSANYIYIFNFMKKICHQNVPQ